MWEIAAAESLKILPVVQMQSNKYLAWKHASISFKKGMNVLTNSSKPNAATRKSDMTFVQKHDGRPVIVDNTKKNSAAIDWPWISYPKYIEGQSNVLSYV